MNLSQYLAETCPFNCIYNEELINEDRISDDQILYKLGVRVLNAMELGRARNLVKHFKIAKSNPRPGVIRYMKEKADPIMDQSDEFFPRRSWDLDSLVGETEYQLVHPDYYKMANMVLKKHKKQHNVLTIFQCSSRKPYSSNQQFNNFYVEPFGELSDFACISNPGIIPFEYSGYYPYRYDEWDIPTEKTIKSIVGITHKYRIVNLCRFLRFQRTMKYDYIIAVIPNPMKDWVFKTAIKHDIEGAADWCKLVLTDAVRKRLYNNPKYKSMGGLINTRGLTMPETTERYARVLKQCTDDKDEFEKLWKARREELKKSRAKRTNESLKEPQYKMHENITYTEVMDAFKKHIKANMDDPSIDKGDNDLFYKSYYWTALDLLLIGLDGDLVQDIDKDYWDLVEHLDKDSDFTKFGQFLYAYKPLMENDNVTAKQCEDEAYELQLLQEPKKLELNDTLFKK